MLLALDTATRNSGLALFDGRSIVAEHNWYSADGQTTELMPRLTQIMAWHALTPADLSGVAVSLGPGSFTGLRIALSVAKGMALAHSLPLVGIATLDAIAFPHLGHRQPVVAVIQAGRARVCWASYQNQPAGSGDEQVSVGSWQGWRGSNQLSDLDALAQHVSDEAWLVGEITPEQRRTLENLADFRGHLASPAVAARRAACLAEIGWLRLQAGQVDHAASLAPIYSSHP
ncbi:MAG: tRNA (adenosine(37)-N6)-threonylcarbamoyltransferase complex dimerization subunit type 1 TsaB [Chloroflexota bacterium]|nr:tRNA (adenosine(37)-N6)-threonylcarbamoyltransferase complex dimerization subunit type 1 TsaB [Chloroflexota bacterium]